MNFEDVVKNRTAVRSFKDEKIKKEELDKILELGRLAPTAKNIQPQKIFVVESKEGLNKIDLASPCRYGAPIVLLICSDKSTAFSMNNHSTYEMDASIVATFLMLAATSLNIGSIWVEMFDKEKVKELFNLDSNIEPICLIPIGYKADDYTFSMNHNVRKDLNETVNYV